ncbi:hypothetical protein MMC12_000914 [Toensbergia leucococca]|nr:hypothetical protein [Toensbergia leucococca]
MSGNIPPIPPNRAEEFCIPVPSTSSPSPPSPTSRGSLLTSTLAERPTIGGLARHTLGIVLLLITVFLWTASNFLASAVFADDTYSNPFFVTYINNAFFSVSLLFIAPRRWWASKRSFKQLIHGNDQSIHYSPILDDQIQAPSKSDGENEEVRRSSQSSGGRPSLDYQIASSRSSEDVKVIVVEDILDVRETAKLSLEFCMVWFVANYFAAACLGYTTVASSTILTSTSGIWTLLFGVLMRVEKFSFRKLFGVLVSLTGIVLTSFVDLSQDNDKNRGSFPHKSQKQIAIGDALAFASALLYGIYSTFMKKRIRNEARVDMPLFFGLVGLFNMIFLVPGFVFFHFTGIETFQLPPSKRVTAIVLTNSITSMVSDYCWAYSMLLTSPLVTTVGLSLTIPLSLVGQMILHAQTSSLTYWIGAGIVFFSFVFINHESKEEDKVDVMQSSASET